METANSRPSYGEGRDALMSAVMRVVAEKGLRGVSYRAVAAEAGVNHNLIAHHFGSIDVLLTATMERAVEQAIANTALALFADPTEDFGTTLVDSVLAEPEVHSFQFEMLLESRRRPELRESCRRLYGNYASSIQAALHARGLRVDQHVSDALFAGLDGLMLQLLTITDPSEVRLAVNRLRHVAGIGSTENGLDPS